VISATPSASEHHLLIYFLPSIPSPSIPKISPVAVTQKISFRKENLESKRSNSIDLWHWHLHLEAMKKLLHQTIQLSGHLEHDSCDICIQAKHQQKFERSIPSVRSIIPFELIHSDLCGPLRRSIGGASYYIL